MEKINGGNVLTKLKKKDYHPYPGFYDLREFNLPITLFRKLWKIQDFLNHVNARKEYYKKYNAIQWGKAKELSAAYQRVLFVHVLNGKAYFKKKKRK